MTEEIRTSYIDEGQLHGWDHGEVPSALFLDPDIAHISVRLFAYLQWRAGKSGSCFPGIPRMAADLDVSEPTIKNSLHELIAADWIRRKRRLGTSTLTHVFERQDDCRQWDNGLSN
jgi:hypothetical protein